jgi:hypothetical protein
MKERKYFWKIVSKVAKFDKMDDLFSQEAWEG